MYLSGARQTVLHVADPIDPETQQLVLRCSDFFGSDNAREHRDGNEEVLRDLDQLRLEITLLRGLTEETARRWDSGRGEENNYGARYSLFSCVARNTWR